GDLLAEDVDNVGDPSLQRQPAVGAEYAKVSRIEMPVAEEGACGGLIVQVSGHPAGEVNPHQAGLADRQNSAFLVDHLDFARWQHTVPSQILSALDRGKGVAPGLGRTEV